MNEKDAADLRALVARIQSGEDRLWWTEHPAVRFAGNVDIECRPSGWVVTQFIDCNDWDYTDSVRAPDGREWDFDVLFAEPFLGDEILNAVIDAWKRTTGTDAISTGEWPPPPGPWPEVKPK